ncbi:DUF485 domain-containing protein [Actinomadura hibisca]|uniref:DUF485 domain-containing protein n=1 Tax=Actinomadura hibisca TaxID=68565 RepID=UPI000A02282E|nr:DUF485 domain-containing protein [Actinomadura hibisca]
MTTESSGPAGGGGAATGADNYVLIDQSPEFQRLRSSFRRFVFPMTAAFLVWYLLYVVLSAYARDFMGAKVVGEINVALVFGLLQFASTFLIAVLYERYARRRLEPLAAAVDTSSVALTKDAHAGAGAVSPVDGDAPGAPDTDGTQEGRR